MEELSCPQCGSQKIFRNGTRLLEDGSQTQRWLCRECGHRFSQTRIRNSKQPQNVSDVETNELNRPFKYSSSRQVCDVLTEESKNLAEEATRQETAQREGTPQLANVRSEIVNYSFWLMKNGYAKATITGRTKLLKRLVNLGADLLDPETVKATIAKQEWGNGRKANAVDAYTSFLQMHNGKWEPPIYIQIRKLPFIPTENEVDQLIGGCNRRMAAFLQLLKETGARCGEACRLKWTDIDPTSSTARITPEKGSNPRMFKLSTKLTCMLNALDKNSSTVFPPNADVMRKSYQRQRRLLSAKLQNPRLMQISFHTLRHYKATMEYAKTKDILHVMQVLGHRCIQNTLIYTQLINFQNDEYLAKVAHSEQETCQLIEAGFEYVCEYENNKIFRKRK